MQKIACSLSSLLSSSVTIYNISYMKVTVNHTYIKSYITIIYIITPFIVLK